MGGSGKPYYYVDDLSGWNGVFVRYQMEIGSLAHEKLLGFLSVPIKLPHLWEFNLIMIGCRVRLLGQKLPL